MNLPLLLNLLAFLALLLGLAQTRHTHWGLPKKVLLGLALGVGFGLVLHRIYGTGSSVLMATIPWLNLVGNGYVELLQMIALPLIFASILHAVARLRTARSLPLISVLSIGTLLLTTAIAALIGILLTNFVSFAIEAWTPSAQPFDPFRFIDKSQALESPDLNIPDTLLSLIPSNPVGELPEAKSSSIIGMIIFAVFVGLAALRLGKEDAKKGRRALWAIDTLQAWLMRLVSVIINLAPYGALALMTKAVVNADLQDLLGLGTYVFVTCLGLALMFLVHAMILAAVGVSPLRFFRNVWPVLTLAFSSSSSMASIPLNIEVQTRRLAVPHSIASLSASFGATLGQSGCSGLYPAILAVLVAPSIGVNTLDPQWIAAFIGVVMLTSVTVGGGALVPIIVLTIMGMPVALVILLIPVEPLLVMGRTALSVNGSMTAGVVTSQLLKETDKPVPAGDEPAALSRT